MGMYDSVWVKCPKCDNKDPIEVQTKNGECLLGNYEWDKLEDPVIAQGVTGEIAKCPKCNCYFELLADVVVIEKDLRILDKYEIETIEESRKENNWRIIW